MFESPQVEEIQNTDQLAVVALYIKNRLESDGAREFGFEDVWFGDQELIPRFPSVAVDAASKVRTLDGIPLMTVNNFTVFIQIYHGAVQDTQLTDLQCVQFAEQVEFFLHEDTNLGGLVIQSFVKSIEMGQAVRNNNSLLRATRLTWEGLSKTGVGQ